MTLVSGKLDAPVLEGLDFILNHFDAPHFPRTISTKTTENKQIVVSNKQEAFARFKQSKYLDCRINGYLYYNGDNGPLSFLFIDLDLSSFNTNKKELDNALALTLESILERLHGNPTVLWTGGGYHVYQPIEEIWFSDYSDFNEFDCVNKKFLRFAAKFVSNDTSDKSNFQSPRSCMLRIPSSFNSKCIDTDKDPQVRIIQKWNGLRSNVKLLLGDFYAYLVNEKINEDKWKSANTTTNANNINTSSSFDWIDTLLKTPIKDYRKNAIRIILVPYLITNKQLEIVQATNLIKKWLDECRKLRPLNFSVNYRITSAISSVKQNKMKPIKFDTLRTRNKELYDKLLLGN